MSKHIVVIPDAHAKDEHPNTRFERLGNYLYDVRPDEIWCLGDLGDFPSLSKYDVSKVASFSGRRYNKDIAAMVEAQDMLFHKFKKNKKRTPKRKLWIGNHEYRAWRAVQQDPVKLEGILNPVKDMQLDKYWDEVVYYDGDVPGISIDHGIAVAHYFTNGNTSSSISGEQQGSALVNKNYMSSICGHSHTFDFAVKTRVDGKKLLGLGAGWFSDERPEFVGNGVDRWLPLVTEMRNVEDGVYEPKFVFLSSIMKEYK